MIKYKLKCKNCDNSFDSWFASSKEYEKLKKLKHLNCFYCSSIKIEKTLMAPSVVNTKKKDLPIIKDAMYNFKSDVKYIIAPHEVDSNIISEIDSLLNDINISSVIHYQKKNV